MKRAMILAGLVMLMAVLSGLGMASGAYYDGENDGSSWENAYVIESLADLILMSERVDNGSDDVGKYYKLSTDIDLTSTASWPEIGFRNDFTGHFDGQGHTITLNSNSYNNLFYSISSDEGTIAVRNLNISGNVTTTSTVCPLALDLYSGIVENCSFIGTMNSYSSLACGLVGRVRGGTIRNCTVSGDILSSLRSGGIAGQLQRGAIENCTIESGTRITSLAYSASGIVGEISNRGTVENCTVEAGTIITASEDAGGIAGVIINGTITNCTIEDGATITGTRYTGGIAGYASGDVLFSGNTWPATYPQAGEISTYISADILAKMATTLGITPQAIPNSAFTSATPVTSSDTASDRQYAASHDMFIAATISPMASLSNGAYYHPVTFNALPSGQTLATSADFSFYPNGLGANMTTAYVAVFNASGDEVTEPSSILGKEGYIAFVIDSGTIRAADLNNTLTRPTITLPLKSDSSSVTPTPISYDQPAVVDSVLELLKDRGYIDSNNQLTNSAFVGGSKSTLTLASDGTFTATVSLNFDVSNWAITVADNGNVNKQFSSAAIGTDSITPTSSNTATISLNPSEISAGSHSVTLTVTPSGASHTASTSLGSVTGTTTTTGTTSSPYYSRGNDGSSWENAYVIESSADLILMSDRVNNGSDDAGKYYKLSADIDLSVARWPGIGDDGNPFTGHFDGQGHTITLSPNYNELFTHVSADKDTIAVRNLSLAGTIDDSSTDTTYNVVANGASSLVWQMHSGIIENCSFTGSVIDSYIAGGLVAYMYGGTIRGCTVNADISSLTSYAGGIAGNIRAGTIENCTVTSGSTITGATYAGGIAGSASSGVTLSSNTWPTQYSEIGSDSSQNQGAPVSDNPSSGNPSSKDVALPPGTVQPIRLSDDVLEKIASAVSVDVSEIHTLAPENITPPKEPTQAMRDYARNDNTEITGKLSTIKVDAEGWYVFKVSLSNELWEKVRSNDISGYKFYGLNDSEAGVSASFINGILNTWELFSLSGEKITSFGAKEFLMVALLNASEPFSLFLAKMLLMLLGGCNTWSVSFIAVGILLLTFRKR